MLMAHRALVRRLLGMRVEAPHPAMAVAPGLQQAAMLCIYPSSLARAWDVKPSEAGAPRWWLGRRGGGSVPSCRMGWAWGGRTWGCTRGGLAPAGKRCSAA